jgi:hypothetical protein
MIQILTRPSLPQVCCPVCRKAIEYDLAALSASATDSTAAEDFHYQPDATMRAMQERMAAMFQAQKAKGGIIDPEEEQKKLLLSHVSGAGQGLASTLCHAQDVKLIKSKVFCEGMRDLDSIPCRCEVGMG